MKKKEKVSPEDEWLDRVLRKLVNGKCWAESRNYKCVWLKSSELSNFF